MFLGPITQLVESSVVLVYGDPGVGKSTLITQVASTAPCDRVLYVGNEELAATLDARVQRVRGAQKSGGPRIEHFVERDIDRVIAHAHAMNAQLLVIDTIQTVVTSKLQGKPGSHSQVGACTKRLIDYAKSTGTPAFLLCLTTKGGYRAGPRFLEHAVDCVFALECCPKDAELRALRCLKNRYGSEQELLFKLDDTGFCRMSHGSEQ